MTKRRPTSPAKSLRRAVAVRQPKKTLQIFCEGERTEPEYLLALKRDPEVRDVSAVDLQVELGSTGSVPMTLVNLAVAAMKDSDGEVDEVWCVFDVEWPQNHPNLIEACDKARRHGVRLAISNPCFELWLVLHHREQTAWLDNDPARRLRRSIDGQGDKGVDPSNYISKRSIAAERARRLARRHSENETAFPRDNPSSTMFELIDSVSSKDDNGSR